MSFNIGFSHVERWVAMGDGCIVHPFAYIGKLPSQSSSLARKAPLVKKLTIGAGTEIGPHVTVYGGASIGARCLIGDGAIIREGARIGDGCIIGAHVFIGYDAEISENVRIQTGTHISDGWKIGRDTFVGINVSTMSDRHPQGYEFTGSVITAIGARCLIGSGAVILPGLTIGDEVTIGAGALVVRSVPDRALVLGQPAHIRLTEPPDRVIPTVHGADHWI